MGLDDWKIVDNEKDYVTWQLKDDRVGHYNSVWLVAKIEGGKWIVFKSIGNATQTFSQHPKNKREAVKLAKEYMNKRGRIKN